MYVQGIAWGQVKSSIAGDSSVSVGFPINKKNSYRFEVISRKKDFVNAKCFSLSLRTFYATSEHSVRSIDWSGLPAFTNNLGWFFMRHYTGLANSL